MPGIMEFVNEIFVWFGGDEEAITCVNIEDNTQAFSDCCQPTCIVGRQLTANTCGRLKGGGHGKNF